MQLQRTGADPERAAALFKKHHRHWLGSLARGAVKGSVVFRDGVVRAVAIAAWKPADVPLADAPELATLEALTLDGGTDLPLPELLSSAARFPSLKSLAARPWVLAGADVALLDRLERLQVIAPRLGDARPPFAALERAGLPALKVLHLAGSSWSEPSALARLPQLGRLSELVVETRHPERWLGLAVRVRLLEPS
ncbi:MAG: hypothetical protein IPJ65_03570 [Archangiaceae bacterium]|nr:hypothetical protein [Archangiaceae bacterium]